MDLFTKVYNIVLGIVHKWKKWPGGGVFTGGEEEVYLHPILADVICEQPLMAKK